MADRGITLTPAAHERVSRVVRTVEGGGLGNVRPAPSRVQPAQIKIIYPATDVQPGAFGGTTANVYAATAVGSTITLWKGGASSASTLSVYTLFQWGLNKRAKALAFRPIPSKQWYAFQPPAIQWGKVSAYTTAASTSVCDIAQVNPTTDCRGAGVDTGTTFAVQLPVRNAVDVKLTTGDVIGFAPTHWGQYVAVSDYSAAGGQPAWGKVASGGVTTGAASTDPDTVQINPSTNAVGDATDTGTTITVILPRRDGVDASLTAGDVIAYEQSVNGQYSIVSDYSAASQAAAGGGGTVSKAGDYLFTDQQVLFIGSTDFVTTGITYSGFTGTTNLEGFGLVTTGSYILEATTATKLLVWGSGEFHVNNFSNSVATTRMNFGARLVLNSSVITDTIRSADFNTTTGTRWSNTFAFSKFLSLSSGDQFYVEAFARALPTDSTGIMRAGLLSIAKVEEPNSTGKIGCQSYRLSVQSAFTGGDTQTLSFSSALNNSTALGLATTVTASTRLFCSADGGGQYDLSYNLSVEAQFTTQPTVSAWELKTVLVHNTSEIQRTERHVNVTPPSTQSGYTLNVPFACRTFLDLSSGDTIEMQLSDLGGPAGTTYAINVGEVTFTRLDTLL